MNNNSSMNNNVVPCPFCGSGSVEVVTGTEDREGYPSHLTCAECGAGGPWIYCKDPDKDYHKLLKQWNTRQYQTSI